jgi:hypothetical protein
MKNIKRLKGYLSFVIMPVLLVMLAIACKKSESNISVVSDDKTKPGVVTDVQVENINGGRTYNLQVAKF